MVLSHKVDTSRHLQNRFMCSVSVTLTSMCKSLYNPLLLIARSVEHRPQTKFREGNVFRGVCLFWWGRGGWGMWVQVHHLHYEIGYMTGYPLLPRHQIKSGTYSHPTLIMLLTSGGHHWKLVKT